MKCFINKLLGSIENSENLPKIKEFIIWYGLYNNYVETPVAFAVIGDCTATIETEGVTFCTSNGTPLTNLEKCTKVLYLIPNKEIKIVIDNVWNIAIIQTVDYQGYVFDIDIFKYSSNIQKLWVLNNYCTGSASILLYVKQLVSINLTAAIKDLDTSYFKDLYSLRELLLSGSTGTLMDLVKLTNLLTIRISTNDDLLLFFKELIKNGYPRETQLKIDSNTVTINNIKYPTTIYYLKHDGTTIYITGTNVDLQFSIE